MQKLYELHKSRKFNINVLWIVVVLLLTSMTVGYSALQQTLFISGKSKINKPDFKIIINSISVKSVEGSGYQSSTPIYSGTEASLYSNLPNTNSKVTYNVSFVNLGKTSGVLDYLIVTSDNNSVKYKIKGINNGDILASGDLVNVEVVAEYWDDVTITSSGGGFVTSDQYKVSSLVSFMFTPYDNNYSNACTSNWDGSSTSQPALVDVYGTSYYAIGNANEFAWFVNTVNGGNTGINGYLMDDICLNSHSPQINNFTGIFDGQNRTIRGYSYVRDDEINEDHTQSIGLFNTNSGQIKNLKLDVNYSDSFGYVSAAFSGNSTITQYYGSLAVTNNGKISNSTVSGTINGDYAIRTNCSISRPTATYYVGGLVAQNNGIITGSYNNANMRVRSTVSRNACNYSRSQTIYEGGIAARNSGYISDSYNRNKVETSVLSRYKNSTYNGRVGGIVGEFASGTISNSYNIGEIVKDITLEDDGTVGDDYVGCLVGTSAGTLSNAYFLDSCSYNTYGTATSSYNLSSLSVDLGNYYLKDNRSINDGYPILGWQN